MHADSKRGGTRGGKGVRGRPKKVKQRVISSDEESEILPIPPSCSKDEVGPVESMEVDSTGGIPAISVPEPTVAEPEIREVGSILEEENNTSVSKSRANSEKRVDIEADISQLEAPTFTTIQRGQPEPMLRLKWNHKVLMIGEKVLNPMIHCCDECLLPILIYGRMIPCKHVFCLTCAKREPLKECPRCNDKVCRVEQSGLGTVFMCTHGGTRYNNKGCRRTYLSQRDLQAHINHRHVSVQRELNEPTSQKLAIDSGLKSLSQNQAMGRKSSVSTPTSTRSNQPNSVRTNLMNLHMEGSEMMEQDQRNRYSNSSWSWT